MPKNSGIIFVKPWKIKKTLHNVKQINSYTNDYKVTCRTQSRNIQEPRLTFIENETENTALQGLVTENLKKFNNLKM